MTDYQKGFCEGYELGVLNTKEPLSSDAVLGDGWRDARREFPRPYEPVAIYIQELKRTESAFMVPDGNWITKTDGNYAAGDVDYWMYEPAFA